MAAPSFLEAGTGLVAATGFGTVSVTAAAGNLIMLHCLIDAVDTLGCATPFDNVEDLAGTDARLTDIAGNSISTSDLFTTSVVGAGSEARQVIAFGRAIADGTVNVSPVSTGAGDIYARLYEFTGVHTGTTLSDILENSTAGTIVNATGSVAAVADTGVTTTGIERLAINAIAVNDDNALGSFTGETGGDWTLSADFGSATGTDGEIGLQTATIASAGTINGGSFTMAAADPWGVLGFAFKPPAAAAFVARPPQLEWQQAVSRASVW